MNTPSSYEDLLKRKALNIGPCLDPSMIDQNLLFKDWSEYCRFRTTIIEEKKTITYKEKQLNFANAKIGEGSWGVIRNTKNLPKDKGQEIVQAYEYLIIPFSEDPSKGVIIFSPYHLQQQLETWGKWIIKHINGRDGFDWYAFHWGEVYDIDKPQNTCKVGEQIGWGNVVPKEINREQLS